MTHMYISAILNAALLMTHLKIQDCLDDSSSDGDILVTSRVATCSLFQGIVPYLLLRCCVPYQSCKEHPLFPIFNC